MSDQVIASWLSGLLGFVDELGKAVYFSVIFWKSSRKNMRVKSVFDNFRYDSDKDDNIKYLCPWKRMPMTCLGEQKIASNTARGNYLNF